VTSLEREVAAERERAGDYMRRWQQAQADLANARRRAQQEQEQLLALAANQAAALVLPALDSLERAFATLPETLHRLTWVEGISLVEFQLRRVLESHGVKPFELAPGDQMDPARHQPIAETETSEHPVGSVAQVVQRGYEVNGRVLRPALVCVAREPSAKPSAQAGGASGADTEAPETEPSASGP
jgi:molecular chaperone GrpE